MGQHLRVRRRAQARLQATTATATRSPRPKGDWALETFIVGPKGKRLASDAFVVDLDELADTATYRLCKPTTRPGTFKIKAKLSVQDGHDYIEGWLPVTRFRLRAPG